MDSSVERKSASRESGFMLYAMMAITVILLGIGVAFMRWSTDEALQSSESAAAMQAYYLAQQGIVEKGFHWLQQQPADLLPTGETTLDGAQVPGVGRYEQVNIVFLPFTQGGDFWARDGRWRISTVGVVRLPVYDEGHSSYKDVKRKAVLYVELRNFADYMYLTEHEKTNFGDLIRFWSGDTLDGRVHSNDTIAIRERPVFFDYVSTTEPDFLHGPGYNPYFRYPPIFNALPVKIPTEAEKLRAGAHVQGHFFERSDYTYYFQFQGANCRVTSWPSGTEQDTLANLENIPISDRTCIFAEGPVWAKGTVLGRVTFGSAQLVRLMDNITVTSADVQGRVLDPEDRNIIGIVSEGDVKIANTWANGRENSRYGSDIVITAAIVALGESFTFENQNDPDSGYVSPTIPDDRGQIFLFGSVTQTRRGYVHRTTNSSTGYLKQYRYDKRLKRQRPPCFFDAEREDGRAIFNIVQWGQGIESPAEVARWNVVRYN